MDDPHYLAARAQAHDRRDFAVHLATYGVINLFLLLVDLLTGFEGWFLFILLGWGVGLALHAFFVFGFGKLMGPEWEARTIRRFMERSAHERPVPDEDA